MKNPFSALLDEILQLEPKELVEFLQTTSDCAVAIMLRHIPAVQREAFYQNHLDMTEIDARAHFEALVKVDINIEPDLQRSLAH